MVAGVTNVVILINQRFYSNAKSFALIFASYGTINIYLTMLFGYTFLGQVTVRSRTLKN